MKRFLFLIPLAFLFLTGCKTAPSTHSVTNTSAPRAPMEIADPPAWAEEGAVYEVYILNASAEGTFLGLIEQLDSIEALGVETLWLMPIHPIGEEGRQGTYGSPYAVRDYYAVNPVFGTMEDFQRLVEEIHTRDMHVIIDMVFNHTAWDHAWIEEHPDWYTTDEYGEIQPPNPDWLDVADLNYNASGLYEEMLRVLHFWVEEGKVDGFRTDAAALVPLDFWKSALSGLNEQGHDLLFLAESDLKSHYLAGFHYTYAWGEYARLKRIWEGETAGTFGSTFYRAYLDREKGPTLNFITNHDETSWDDTPIGLFGGLEGSRAAAVAMFCLPGIPLIYNAQELGDPKTYNLFERTPIEWVDRESSRAFYSRILQLRYEHPVLREGEFKRLTYESRQDIIAYRRILDGQTLFVLVNPRDQEIEWIWPDSMEGEFYRDLWTGEQVVAGNRMIPPHSWLILEEE